MEEEINLDELKLIRDNWDYLSEVIRKEYKDKLDLLDNLPDIN